MRYLVTIDLVRRSRVTVEAPGESPAIRLAKQICSDDDHVDVDLDVDWEKRCVSVEEIEE